MFRRQLCFLILVIYVTLLTGCYDINEVDQMIHVLAIGIDRGVSDKWRITFQFPNQKGDGEKGGGASVGQNMGKVGQDGHSTVTIDAPSFYTGIDMLNASLPRRINLMHAEFLVLSEDFAKSGLLGEYIAPIARFRQTRKSMHVIVCKGSAMEFVEANMSIIGSTLSKNMQLISKESEITGYFPYVTLNDFYEGIKSTYNNPIAILGAVNDFRSFKLQGEKQLEKGFSEGEYYAGELPRKGENKLELFGTAVFDGDKMVGELNGWETRLMLIGRGEFKTAFLTVEDPKDPESIVVIDLRQARAPEINIEFINDKPVIRLNAYLEGDIMSVQKRINYEDPKLKPILEKAVEKNIKEGMDKLVSKSKSINADIFNLSRTVVKHFKTIQEWEDYNWLERYKDAEITTEIQFAIRRSGTQLKSSPINTTEDK